MSQERVDHPQERRLVTILFADLVGYTSVSETRDPELIQSILGLCFDRLSSEIRRFGGYVDKVVGDEIMATPTVDLGDLGVGTAGVLCGTDESGTVTVTGRTMPLTARLDGSLCYDSADCPFELDPMAEPHHKSVKFTVVGPPADLRITAEPAGLVCDGTAGSTVSATVIDAEGSPVANGGLPPKTSPPSM